jgi:curved DNA-binding protein CbpA
MQNLYDLLGVRPDDDAQNLRTAFREAAKASHPDHHGGDPEAAARFRRIAQAYDILRDAAKRAAYDQLLEIQRRPLRAKLKQTVSELKRHIITDVTIGVVLTILLAGGYELFARMSQMPINDAGGMTAGESAGTAPIQPGGQSDAAGGGRLASARAAQMPVFIPEVSGDESAANERSSVLEVAKGEPVPDLALQTIAAVRGDSESDVLIHQAATKASADDAGKSPGE